MAQSQVTCANCGEPFFKENREINRTRKRGKQHFCTRSCSAAWGASKTRAQEMVLTCPCGTRFKTTTRVKAAKHCSRSCASKFSMNAERREAQRQAGLAASGNLLTPAEALKRREGWKYAALEDELQGRPHEFEFELGGYVFDLALLDTKVLVEFDGPYHEKGNQPQVDENKDQVAQEAGFLIVRREVLPAAVIGPGTIAHL